MTNPLRERVLGDDGNFVSTEEALSKPQASRGELLHRVMKLEKRIKEMKKGGDQIRNKEYEDMKHKYNQMCAENRLLKEKLKQFEVNYPKLEARFEELEVEYRSNLKDMNGLKLELESSKKGKWKKEYDKLKGEYSQLTKEFEELNEEVVRLRK